MIHSKGQTLSRKYSNDFARTNITACIFTGKKIKIKDIWNRCSVCVWPWILHFKCVNQWTDDIKFVDALFHTMKTQPHNVQFPTANRNYTACAETSEAGMTPAQHFIVLKICTVIYLWKIDKSRQVSCCVEYKITRWRPCENFCSLWETGMTKTNWRPCMWNGV